MTTLPYQFEPLLEGRFNPGNQYGVISRSQFSLIGISMRESKESGESNTSDEEDDSSQNSYNSEEVNTSDEEDSSSQKSEDSHTSEDSVTDDYINAQTNEHNLQVSNYEGKKAHIYSTSYFDFLFVIYRIEKRGCNKRI